MRSIVVSPSAHERRDHEPRGRAQVGRHHGRARQPRHALDDRRVAFDLDRRAEAAQFLHVHEAVLEDRLGDAVRAVGDAVERHELRLHVGRERRIFGRAHVRADERMAVRAHADRVVRRSRARRPPRAACRAPRRACAGARRARRPRRRPRRRGRGRAQERAGLDAVRHDRVTRAVQPLDAFDRRCGRCRRRRSSRPSRRARRRGRRPPARAPRSRSSSCRRRASRPSSGSRCR